MIKNPISVEDSAASLLRPCGVHLEFSGISVNADVPVPPSHRERKKSREMSSDLDVVFVETLRHIRILCRTRNHCVPSQVVCIICGGTPLIITLAVASIPD